MLLWTILIAFVLFCFSIFSPVSCWGCTTVVAGKTASSTGRVLVGHNEDDPGRLVLRHGIVPSRLWNKGDKLIAEDGAARIPQPALTLGFFWSEVRGKKGLTNADSFYNERGVLVVSDSCMESRRDNEPDRIAGGVGYALRRAVAERAENARSGVEIAIGLVEKYGYRDPGRGYVIADAHEAWILQLVGGRDYCAVRVKDDEAVFFPNHFTIRGGDLLRRPYRISSGLLEKAQRRGWSDESANDPTTFDFAKAFQDPASWRSDGNTCRHRHGAGFFLGYPLSEDDDLPFAAIPRRKVTPEMIKAILRSHYEGTSDDIRSAFAGRSPHFTSIRRICSGGTVESMVVLLSDDPLFTELLIARGRPCCEPYQPLWGGITVPPEEMSPHENSSDALDCHCTEDLSLLALSDGLAWWRIFQDQCLVDLFYEEFHPSVAEWIDRREGDLAEKALVIRAAAEEKAAGGEMEEARRILTEGSAALARETASQKMEILSSVRLLKICPDRDEVVKGDSSSELTVSFFSRDDSVPLESSFRMGQGGTVPQQWAAPLNGSLRRDGDFWSLRFRVRELTESAVPCFSEFWIGGRDDKNSVIAGRCVMKISPPSESELFGGLGHVMAETPRTI